MKYVFLVWSGIWRKRMRAALILVQVIVAFTLFGVLQGVDTGISQAIAKTHSNRMYVFSSVSAGSSFGDVLPLALRSKIGRVPGVVAITYESGFGGIYQNPNQQVAIDAVDPASYARIFPDIVIPQRALEALIRTRTGAIVGKRLARRYGWKAGEEIPIQSPLAQRNGSHRWTFDIEGLFTEPDNPRAANFLLMNYGYLNEARVANRNTVGDFVIQINNPKRAARIGYTIDTMFANSPHGTRTLSESALVAAEIERIGDIGFLAHAVTAAAFFAMLLATGTLMMQTIRERTPELAMMKAVGFSDRRVMSLILAEVFVSCLAGAAIGLGIAVLLLPRARSLIGVVTHMPEVVVAAAFVAAICLALAGGAIPAWRALKLEVAQALVRG